jgi:PAS domain S-box-containing protein
LDSSPQFRKLGNSHLQVLWEDGERALCRTWHRQADGRQTTVLAAHPVAAHPTAASLGRLSHEYGLKDQLDSAWAVRPLELVRDESGRTLLLLEDNGSEPLSRLLEAPVPVGRFLSLALGMVAALGKAHQHGLVHKDIKPANFLVTANGDVRLTGFGIASRLLRERQAPEPPETIAGTLAYMAPEQTGRMNRSIDVRSDLYSLGVTLYQMLTGSLPFAATDPMEWVHCHIARKPVPPDERLAGIPLPISAIILKLMAKSVEERYQTTAGVERDLRRCLSTWGAHHHIEDFPLGGQDTPDRLLIPEKLYGRESEVDALLGAFDRVVAGGATELMLISGYSGIGKSSVVNELHRVLVPPRGLFAAGKFDQYKRDIPYSTLAQAFQSLVRALLGKDDAELAGWRDALVEALGPNARLIVEVVPELKLIIGEQPPVPVLSPQEAQRRFQLVFQRFIGVFARAEHPLALFLDDLQWLDAATMDMLEELLTRSELRHLMLIGAYRDNEVAANHPLMRKLEAIKAAGGKVTEISLAPLGQADVRQLLADALRCEPALAAPLAQLVHQKSGGNPFFAIQFFSSLANEGLLAFDHDAARWRWDVGRIHAKGHTDNVVALMVEKLTRLPDEAQRALQQLACLGNSAETSTLSIALEAHDERIHAALLPAVQGELVERLALGYRFVHDRVQEAAYSLIDEELRGEAHLRIGRLLVERTPAAKRGEAIFEIVNHLNRAIPLMTSATERERLAEFNLIAGRRAKDATAHVSALRFFAGGAALLDDDGWGRRPELVFELELNRAECEFLTGAATAADERLAALAIRARNPAEAARVACLRLDLYSTLAQNGRAVAVGLEYLHHLGIEWQAQPTDEEARCEYDRIWSVLGDRAIEGLVELPLMSDPASLATVDVLTQLAVAAFYTDPNLLCLIICRIVNLSLERGNSDGSCFAFEWLGSMIAGPRYGDYQAGFRFGRLGCALVEQRGLKRFDARTYMSFGGIVLPWSRHVREGRPLVRRAFEAANRSGDLNCAAACCHRLNANLLAAGDPLEEVQAEAERGLEFARKLQAGITVDTINSQLGLIRTLRGLTPTFGSFDDAGFDELQTERRLSGNPDLALVEFRYWLRKLQARYLAGEHAGAAEASSRAERLLWTSLGHLETAEYHFYSALGHAASCDSAPADQRRQHVAAMLMHHRQLQLWAANCPENFENRAALVGAEIARIEGRALDAQALYEQAIRSAEANGFVHHEALANELAARFYASRSLPRFAQLCLRNARSAYLRWGATGKVRQFDELHPQLGEEMRAPGAASTIGTPVEHLDLATVIKASQAVSGEIVLDNLVDTLMRTAIEQAGAERGLLIVPGDGEARIEAEASSDGNAIRVQLCNLPAAETALPNTLLHYVLRTREAVVVDDASAGSLFAADPYIRQRRARSIFCLPLLAQTRLIGVLYLENSLASGVFASARVAVLKLLASQAAIALENARLYRNLAEREARIRRLVDANIVGIFICDLEGLILEANDAFLRIVGYERDDLLSGRLRWTDLTPPEWLERDLKERMPTLQTTGTLQPYEKEYFRKDGSRVPVLLGAAKLEESGIEGIAFVLDLSERKRVEANARQMQLELAHANRVTAIGQLAASIVHEMRQPVAATVLNASTGQRLLGLEPANVADARRAFDRIVRDGNRAGEVIRRIQGLVKKAPASNEALQLNDTIREVVALASNEAGANGVSVRVRLAETLPSVKGDRVQLQQVILNLMINAIDAMSAIDEGPRELTISTAIDEAGAVLVTVRDSGPGIAPENRERLFEPFYTTKASGMGMGLSICHSIVEAHGGRLWVESNLPRGAAFQFVLPVQTDSSLVDDK